MSSARRLLGRLAMEVAAVGGVVWVYLRRRRYRRRGRMLTEQERSVLAPYFDEALLGSVRVCEVPRIEAGLPRWLISALRLPVSVDISSASGMAFVDAVVISDAARQRNNAAAILFHELVHCAQYRELGLHRFLRQYLVGWAATGFDYFAIALEREAYELQDRFEARESFDVLTELRCRSTR